MLSDHICNLALFEAKIHDMGKVVVRPGTLE